MVSRLKDNKESGIIVTKISIDYFKGYFILVFKLLYIIIYISKWCFGNAKLHAFPMSLNSGILVLFLNFFVFYIPAW